MTGLFSQPGEDLAVAVRLANSDDERLLAREPLQFNDLILQRNEAWLAGMRSGKLDENLNSIAMELIPGANQGEKIDGYLVQLRQGEHNFYRHHFGIRTLSTVAQRAVKPLIEQGALNKEDTIHYYLTAMPSDGPSDGAADRSHNQPAADGARVTTRHEPVVFDTASLDEYLANSEPLTSDVPALEQEADNPIHCFVDEAAWQDGRELARRGVEKESAGLWTGRVFRDTKSPEVFVRLEECIEVKYAEEEQYSVTLTGESWANARALLQMRRQRLGRPQETFLGSVHGHNFFPAADADGNRMCEACATAEKCSRTTAVASTADETWHASIFSAAPWAVLLIWGFNAREEDVWNLYGLSGAALKPRGLRQLR